MKFIQGVAVDSKYKRRAGYHAVLHLAERVTDRATHRFTLAVTDIVSDVLDGEHDDLPFFTASEQQALRNARWEFETDGPLFPGTIRDAVVDLIGTVGFKAVYWTDIPEGQRTAD